MARRLPPHRQDRDFVEELAVADAPALHHLVDVRYNIAFYIHCVNGRPITVDGVALFLSKWQGRIMSTTVLAPSILSEEERLENMLLRRLGNRVRNLRVLVLPDGLILQGCTATYHAKQIAQHAVMELAEMPILANDIEVI